MDESEYEKIKNPEDLLRLEQQQDARRQKRLIFLLSIPAAFVAWLILNTAETELIRIPWERHKCSQACAALGYQDCLISTMEYKPDTPKCLCLDEKLKVGKGFELK